MYVKFFVKKGIKKHGFHNETFILETVFLHTFIILSVLFTVLRTVSCSFITVFFLICRNHPIISPAVLSQSALLLPVPAYPSFRKPNMETQAMLSPPAFGASGFSCLLAKSISLNVSKYHQIHITLTHCKMLMHRHIRFSTAIQHGGFKMYLQSMVWLKVSAKSTWVSSSPAYFSMDRTSPLPSS